jgi:hypothetical protein
MNLSQASVCILLAVALAVLSGGSSLRAAYGGPVPPPTDVFGSRGPYVVEIRTLPSPSFPGRVVTVYSAQGAAGPRPTWFFSHGFGGTNVLLYDELLRHWASHGWTAVFSPYPVDGQSVELYQVLFDGFVAAANQYPNLIDTRKVGFAGHSFGGGATPSLALRAVRERGWGSEGLALFPLAPWYSHQLSNQDLAAFPAHTQLVMQVYEDDVLNDHRMAIDIYRRMNLPAANKDYLMVHSDLIESYPYRSAHSVPTGSELSVGDREMIYNALDAWAVLRISQALAVSAWTGDPQARAIALGHGSETQVQMGSTPSGRALRRMTSSIDPVPMFPQSRYAFPFDGLINPRLGELAPSTPGTQLKNLSVRAYSGPGEATLIVGASVSGNRPKSLLWRAAGPSLAAFGVGGVMANPLLTTFRGAATDLINDNWADYDREMLEVVSAESGVFRFNQGSLDSALLGSFAPGGWTAHVTAATGGAGVALLEIYAADIDTTTRLGGLSARGRVGAGGEVLIVGFIIEGPTPLRLLLRGVGPALAAFGVGGTLADPQLTLFNASTVIASNDSWQQSSDAAAIAAAGATTGAFPLAGQSRDAALLVTLSAGSYTLHLRGGDGGSGIGLAEIYVVP